MYNQINTKYKRLLQNLLCPQRDGVSSSNRTDATQSKRGCTWGLGSATSNHPNGQIMVIMCYCYKAPGALLALRLTCTVCSSARHQRVGLCPYHRANKCACRPCHRTSSVRRFQEDKPAGARSLDCRARFWSRKAENVL